MPKHIRIGIAIMTVKNSKKNNGAAMVQDQDDDLATHFGSLNLSKTTMSVMPDPDSCLAHLRLLAAFEKLKNQVGLQDGIWDIWDKRAASADNSLDVLVKLREKRWAIYVARAVDRYEAWWRSFESDMLLEEEMAVGAGEERYSEFTEAKPASWRANMLPPLGTCCRRIALGDYRDLIHCRCPFGMACAYAKPKVISRGISQVPRFCSCMWRSHICRIASGTITGPFGHLAFPGSSSTPRLAMICHTQSLPSARQHGLQEPAETGTMLQILCIKKSDAHPALQNSRSLGRHVACLETTRVTGTATCRSCYRRS